MAHPLLPQLLPCLAFLPLKGRGKEPIKWLSKRGLCLLTPPLSIQIKQLIFIVLRTGLLMEEISSSGLVAMEFKGPVGSTE